MTDRSHPDVLGLRASLPAPGWTVLDAAREQRFTGEVRARTDDGADYRVYVDRGDVYCAERSTDPSLGTRLVEAGAINSAQLDYGMLRIGDIEHLGRLFDRVPSINRDAVFVLNQLMTEETMRSMAGRAITDVDATPYRHHPSGMHRWTTVDLSHTPAPWGEMPELSLPAPAPDARPISVEEPAPAPTGASRSPTTGAAADAASSPPDTSPRQDTSSPQDGPVTEPSESQPDAAGDLFLDDVVQWDEPSLLVSSTTGAAGTAPNHERRTLFAAAPLGTTDWVDDLGPDGVADAPAAPARHAKLPPVSVPPVEQFEVIWPSGEIEDVAPTGPVDETAGEVDETPSDEEPPRPDDVAEEPHTEPDDDTRPGDALHAPSDETTGDERPDDQQRDGASDDEVAPDDALAVRRAVATIDTGSLAVRRRLASPGEDLPTPPGRLIVGRDHHTAWRSGNERPTGSVFDAQPVEPPEPPTVAAPTDDHQERRAGALRRLISSLRKTDD